MTICLMIYNNIDEATAAKLFNTVFTEARKRREAYVKALFVELDVPEVFSKYRDAFTQSIDIGLRLFTKSDIGDKLRVIVEDCDMIFILCNDEKAKKAVEDLGKNYVCVRI